MRGPPGRIRSPVLYGTRSWRPGIRVGVREGGGSARGPDAAVGTEDRNPQTLEVFPCRSGGGDRSPGGVPDRKSLSSSTSPGPLPCRRRDSRGVMSHTDRDGGRGRKTSPFVQVEVPVSRGPGPAPVSTPDDGEGSQSPDWTSVPSRGRNGFDRRSRTRQSPSPHPAPLSPPAPHPTPTPREWRLRDRLSYINAPDQRTFSPWQTAPCLKYTPPPVGPGPGPSSSPPMGSQNVFLYGSPDWGPCPYVCVVFGGRGLRLVDLYSPDP